MELLNISFSRFDPSLLGPARAAPGLARAAPGLRELGRAVWQPTQHDSKSHGSTWAPARAIAPILEPAVRAAPTHTTLPSAGTAPQTLIHTEHTNKYRIVTCHARQSPAWPAWHRAPSPSRPPSRPRNRHSTLCIGGPPNWIDAIDNRTCK